MDLIKEEDLVHGEVYRIRSRNLLVGVWVAESHGFIGVRWKFNHEYPFMEYHYDHDPHIGTVNGMEALGVQVPREIPLIEGESRCRTCGTPTHWTRERGRFHVDGRADHEPDSAYYDNKELLEFLRPLNEAEAEVRQAEHEQKVLEQESLRWKPKTEPEARFEEAREATRAWQKEQAAAGRMFGDYIDEFHERTKADRKILEEG